MQTIIETKNITKKYSNVTANKNINLKINEGEIHAIIGENGAGKTTLMNILYGLEKASEGDVFINGKKVELNSPLDAIKHGIGMVHQHFMLVPSFSVAENISLGYEKRKHLFFLDKKRTIKECLELSKKYGLEVNPHAKIKDLSIGIQQRVEILKVLYKGADIIIFDEPTAVLSPKESDELFRVLKTIVKDLGKTIIIITHKLKEVLSISDRCTVMRNGSIVDTLITKETNETELAEMMVGRDFLYEDLNRLNSKSNSDFALSIKDLVVLNKLGLKAIDKLSLKLKAGEIVGIAGIEGNGQSELIEALTGLREIESGTYIINNHDAKNKKPKEIRDLSLAFIPEDRIANGLSLEATVSENLIIGSQNKKEFKKMLNIQNEDYIENFSDKLIDNYDIRTNSRNTLAKNLSGGNMQKMVIAREFSFNSKILIIAQATRGVDIGAIEFIHKEIIQKRNEGVAILLISAELDEIFRLSDRILTIYEGSITGEFLNGEISRQEIGLYMTGHNAKGGSND